ncbi:MAG: hypothetical protein JSW11_03575 [Candidatus Heimdallarchaeota archaeon]|nr:MAG: hypothetical protein JSW11_03575 [Candidatus Heimdallarchaeota archaeon]
MGVYCKNERSFLIIIFFVFSSSFSSILASGGRNVTQELEWHVKVGDTKTYIITKLRKNGNPHEYIDEVDTPQGIVNITMKKGTTIKLDILKLNLGAHLNCTYNDNITADGDDFSYYVRKTTENKSYWEEKVGEDEDVSFTDNLMVVKRKEPVNETVFRLFISKWNFMTGWMESESFKKANSTYVFAEWEVDSLNTDLDQIIFVDLPLSLSVLLIILIIYRKRKKKVISGKINL